MADDIIFNDEDRVYQSKQSRKDDRSNTQTNLFIHKYKTKNCTENKSLKNTCFSRQFKEKCASVKNNLAKSVRIIMI